MIDGHGDDIYRYGGMVRHNFSTNVYNGFDHSGLTAHLASVADTVRNYPEPAPVSVERVLAHQYGICPASVIVTNGATEAIYLIACVTRGMRSAVIVPTFSEYADACAIYGHRLFYVHGIDRPLQDVDVVWMCNPNNPTGEVRDKRSLLSVIDAFPDTIFVIDQAYADYTCEPVITPDEAVERTNLVLLGSLTKRFAVPGLRIGYAVAASGLLERIRAVRMPWSVNQLAIEGAMFLLNHRDDYTIDRRLLHDEAQRIGRAFERLGMEVCPTDSNMLLSCLPQGSAAELKEWLVKTYGILIRDASNFRGLTTRHFRVAALTPDENDLLIKAVTRWISG